MELFITLWQDFKNGFRNGWKLSWNPMKQIRSLKNQRGLPLPQPFEFNKCFNEDCECDLPVGWDRDLRKVAIRNYLKNNVLTRESVILVYGEELVLEVERDLADKKPQ